LIKIKEVLSLLKFCALGSGHNLNKKGFLTEGKVIESFVSSNSEKVDLAPGRNKKQNLADFQNLIAS